jgi:hypothetical protein
MRSYSRHLQKKRECQEIIHTIQNTILKSHAWYHLVVLSNNTDENTRRQLQGRDEKYLNFEITNSTLALLALTIGEVW